MKKLIFLVIISIVQISNAANVDKCVILRNRIEKLIELMRISNRGLTAEESQEVLAITKLLAELRCNKQG